MTDFANLLLSRKDWRSKLLPDDPHVELLSFWRKYETIAPQHQVFRSHGDKLHRCVPIHLHGDEGTSFGKKGLFQFSWSPLLSAGACGLNRYFMITQILHKYYAKLAKGNFKGNPALDTLMRAGVQSCLEAFTSGVGSGDDTWYLVTLGLTGDHVFHSCLARTYCDSIAVSL